MKRIRSLVILSTLASLLHNCKETERTPLSDSNTPQPVIAAVVENLAGSARISYVLPDDNNILYVTAEYEVDGEKKSVKSSFYGNELMLQGFGKSQEYNVSLYAVNRNEKQSTPLVVTIHPLDPPLYEVFNSLVMSADFGGVLVNFTNPMESDIVLEVLTTDVQGDWITADTYYTSRGSGYFAVRGFDPEERTFGVSIRDRWDNQSDTLITKLVPIFEEKLDRTKFQPVLLPTDAAEGYGWAMPNLWNGVIMTHTNVDNPGFHTAPGSGLPQWFTFDLGVTANLSRFKVYQRGGFYSFSSGNPKRYEIWGSNNPAQDGSWDSWYKLADCLSEKPSGRPALDNSDEDLALVAAGEEFVFPPGTPPARYIRFKTLDTWGGSDALHIIELEFWGSETN